MTHATMLQPSRRPRAFGVFMALLLAALPTVTPVAAAESPSMQHTFLMRGQIVEAKDAALVLCIGTADGASVGQELDVVHHRRVNVGPKGMGRFEREVVGKARIDGIVDDHYAEATVISGRAGMHDSVELARGKQ